MSYLAIKHLHISCVVLSGLGFSLRGVLMLRASRLLDHRVARVLPHVIDSVLLASALTLAVLSGQYPFVQAWLTAKLGGLLAYIGLGSLALKRGRSQTQRAGAFAGALLVYGYIVSVALTRQPWPFA